MHGSKKKAPRGAFKKRRLRKLRLTDHDQPRLPPFWRSCLGLNPARMAGLILLGRTSTCQPLFLANLRISFPAPGWPATLVRSPERPIRGHQEPFQADLARGLSWARSRNGSPSAAFLLGFRWVAEHDRGSLSAKCWREAKFKPPIKYFAGIWWHSTRFLAGKARMESPGEFAGHLQAALFRPARFRLGQI